MSKRKFGGDEYDDNISPSNSSKFARGLFSAVPIDPPPRPQNEILLSELADRRCERNRSASSDGTNHFADELVSLNERFVAYCAQSVRRDPHCFLFTGFNDYMEHFMGLFATYLAPLSDDPMTLICLQRLRAHCSSKFANVGKFVSQVKDACTSTDTSIQNTMGKESISLCSQMDSLRSTYDIARKMIPNSPRQTTSTAGRRCREVMKAMQQMMHIPLSSRSTANVSFAPVLLKNFNFNTTNSSIKQTVTSLNGVKKQNERRYFNAKHDLNIQPNVLAGESLDAQEHTAENADRSRIWRCQDCETVNHIDSSCCSLCSAAKNQPNDELGVTTNSQPIIWSGPFAFGDVPTSQRSTIHLHSVTPSIKSALHSISPTKMTNGLNEESNLDIAKSNASIGLASALTGWTCSVCLVSNSKDKSACVCCTTPKPADSSVPVSVKNNSMNTQITSDKTQKPSAPWFCTICKKVQQNVTSQTNCSNCGAIKKASVGFKSQNFSSLSNTSIPTIASITTISKETTGVSSSDANTLSQAEDDESDKEGQNVDHCEKDAIFASKCKMYYQQDNRYILKSVGFVNILIASDMSHKNILFRADNFNGSTMLTAKVNNMMNPSIVKGKNVMLLTIAYPRFFEDQDLSKPLVVLFKMKSDEDARLLLNALRD